ncbi:MAG: hypothetical protein ACD_71C00206G0003 [uncultured bacterium (gcode 4)]|uniref:SET domain-containing protein n=1 Tax=uncultured bacterium (gcode 4) TaxID=1234023 RepID=K1ZII2_9BACT|nr:MAG: hypothetical protein ACD_71C00206G0003 [uncultured bacterium (gcode 4)]
MKTDKVVIKQSDIHGKGVFATRDFKAGEIILQWDKSVILSDVEFERLSDNEKQYVNFMEGVHVYMQEPEKYVNHSSNPNTIAKQFCDIATRDIKEGEEITSNYDEV